MSYHKSRYESYSLPAIKGFCATNYFLYVNALSMYLSIDKMKERSILDMIKYIFRGVAIYLVHSNLMCVFRSCV